MPERRRCLRKCGQIESLTKSPSRESRIRCPSSINSPAATNRRNGSPTSASTISPVVPQTNRRSIPSNRRSAKTSNSRALSSADRFLLGHRRLIGLNRMQPPKHAAMVRLANSPMCRAAPGPAAKYRPQPIILIVRQRFRAARSPKVRNAQIPRRLFDRSLRHTSGVPILHRFWRVPHVRAESKMMCLARRSNHT